MEDNKQTFAYEPIIYLIYKMKKHLLLQNSELKEYGLCYIWHNI